MDLKNLAGQTSHTFQMAYELEVEQYNRLEYTKTGKFLCHLYTLGETRARKEWEGDFVFILTYKYGGKQILRVQYDSFSGALLLMADAILNTLLGNAAAERLQSGDYQTFQDLNAQRNRLMELIKEHKPGLRGVSESSFTGPFDAAAILIEGK